MERKQKSVRLLSSTLKAFDLLDVLTEQKEETRLAELSRLVGESRATTYQRLMTLVGSGWVEQTESGAFRLSLRIVSAAQAALNQANLGERFNKTLQDIVLKTNETASLAVIDGTKVRIVQRVESEVNVRAAVHVGSVLSFSESSSGLVLSAHLDDLHRTSLRENGIAMASEETLEKVRREGFAISTGKDVPGVRSVAVPLFGANDICISALSVVSPDERFDAAKFLSVLRTCG